MLQQQQQSEQTSRRTSLHRLPEAMPMVFEDLQMPLDGPEREHKAADEDSDSNRQSQAQLHHNRSSILLPITPLPRPLRSRRLTLGAELDGPDAARLAELLARNDEVAPWKLQH